MASNSTPLVPVEPHDMKRRMSAQKVMQMLGGDSEMAASASVTNDADAMKNEAERLQLINKQLEKIVTLTGDTDAVTGSKE